MQHNKTPYPNTVPAIVSDYNSRKKSLKRALLEDQEKLYTACDPNKENLCLRADAGGPWIVEPPGTELPPLLPEPCLGINFARDGMEREDWLKFVAIQCDIWLLSVAFFYAARFDAAKRTELFAIINEQPTLYEEVLQNVKSAPQQPRGVSSKRNPHAEPVAEEEITPALKGRTAELYWPDDGKWYEVVIRSVNMKSQTAKVVYVSTGEEEELPFSDAQYERQLALLPM